MGITKSQIISQSESALKQWREVWTRNALVAKEFEMKSLAHFEGSGAGRACLLVANGGSLETEIETIRKFQDNVDIICCDKSLGHLLDHGITPTFCLVADANVDFGVYGDKWKDQLQNTILVSSVCANPAWAKQGNWKETYFYCVKDAIATEKIFQKISGCPNVIAAGTNVSNTMLIFLTQCDIDKSGNFFGYDKYLLIGFDYCWTVHGNYYAFDHEGKGKRYYMRHNYGRTIGGDLCYTSNNLGFSLSWIQKYIEAYRLPVVQCSRDTVFPTSVVHGGWSPLEKQMQYRGSVDRKAQTSRVKKIRELLAEKRRLTESLLEGRRTQYLDFAASL